uniref:Uncharacterized protein n=1 Tax=Graphocephala atropunctata TaxID=36148 RepID=A0A1B6KBT0_9HEMI
MPVAKVKNETTNYDIVIKNLRRREVSCLVAALTPPKSTPSNIVQYCGSESDDQAKSTLPKCPQKRLYEGGKNLQTSSTGLSNKRAKSLGAGPRRSSTPSPFIPTPTPTHDTQKRTYRKRGSSLVHSKTRTRVSAFYLDFVQKEEETSNEVPKKRAYRKKSLQTPEAKMLKKSVAEDSVCLWMDDNANAPPTPTKATPREKGAFSRKIPPVPHNTPAVASSPHGSETISTFSSLSLECPSSSGLKLQKKSFSLQDDDSTCTGSTVSWDSSQSSTAMSGGKRRGRRSLWLYYGLGEEEEEEEVEVSEYEMLRRKNIEENLKMLRQMFADTGLQLEKKPETPKSRKNYTRVPLPPPRPKSARIEDRTPLDFSRLTQELSLT